MSVLTIISRSECVPLKTGMSIGMRTEYGLFSRTPGNKRNVNDLKKVQYIEKLLASNSRSVYSGLS